MHILMLRSIDGRAFDRPIGYTGLAPIEANGRARAAIAAAQADNEEWTWEEDIAPALIAAGFTILNFCHSSFNWEEAD